MTGDPDAKPSFLKSQGAGLLDWKNIVPAMFSLGLAAAYARVILQGQGLVGLGPDRLTRLMQIEFLVIHSFPFLGLIALVRPTAWRHRAIQWSAFGGLLSIYLWMAFTEGGWESVLTLLGLTLATYVGFLLHLEPETQVRRLGFRWLISFALFILLAIVAGMPQSVNDWDGSEEVRLFGLLYFLAHGLLEWTGFYQARRIARLAEISKKQPPA